MRFAMMVAALSGLLFAAAPAAADTVTFSTSFQFTSTGTNTVNLGPATFTLNGVTNKTVNTPANSTSFGSVVYARNGAAAQMGTFEFTFTVTQISPAGNASSSGNQFHGIVTMTSGGIAAVDFITAPVEIGNIRYRPQDAALVFAGNGGTATILGSVTAVPLPAAAWGGMALCAMVGMWKIRRKAEPEA